MKYYFVVCEIYMKFTSVSKANFVHLLQQQRGLVAVKTIYPVKAV